MLLIKLKHKENMKQNDCNCNGNCHPGLCRCECHSYNKKTKNKAAQSLGSLGGKARANKMTKEERSESARKAANKRWNKSVDNPHSTHHTSML